MANDTIERKLNKREMLLTLGFVPPWLDMELMCLCLPYTPNTVDKLVDEGVLPPPRKRGGKLVWKWSEVDERLTSGSARSPDAQAEGIRNATRLAAETRPGH